MPENNLRRDKQLKKQLEREYQVERPPESYFQAVQSALDSLPDELPVKSRPLPQRVMRGFAACAACLVLLAAGAYGLDLAAPSLMESMPGVGQIFQQLNHHEETEKEPQPTPSPERWDASEVESEQLPDVPEFSQVDVIAADNSAMFSVVNASSDGVYLTLDLQLQVWDPSMVQCYQLSPCSYPMDLSNNTSVLMVNDQEAEPLNAEDNLRFTRLDAQSQDSATFTATWTYLLPQEVSHGEALSIMLDAPILYGLQEEDGSVLEFPCEFSVIFECYADLQNTLISEESVEDNGVILSRVVVTPSAVITQQTIPYFGTLESTLLVPVNDLINNTQLALGSYPVLTTQDGQQLESNYFPLNGIIEPITSDISDSGQQQGAFTFDPPPEDTTQLILTLYEYPTTMTDYNSGIPVSNRVTAEFTIDLKRGTVYSSQNYLTQGRQKLDQAQSASLDRTPSAVNGYICGQPEEFGSDYLQIPLYTKDLSYRPDRPVSLWCYMGDELWDTYSSVDEAEFNAMDGDQSFYHEVTYSYYQQTLIDPDPTGHGPYQVMIFRIENIPEGHILNPDDIHFSLVDQDTDEVLVEDVVQAYYQGLDEVLGTHLEESQYGTSSADKASTESTPDTQEEAAVREQKASSATGEYQASEEAVQSLLEPTPSPTP
ncbi:MAG: hypothetical protein ACOYJZ_09650 [Acutalibacter sp.]|jgi:hypothetical protein